MSNFQVYGRFEGRFDNTVVQGGSIERPVFMNVGGTKFDQVFSIANAANTTIYNAQLSDFDFLFIQSDYDLRLLLTDTASNTFSINIKGTGVNNRYGIPFILGLDETSSGQTLNTVQAFNTSGNTAKVRTFAAT